MRKIYFLLHFCLVTSAVNAQSKSEIKVAAVVENFKAALISGDRAQLEKITSPNLSYGHSSGKIEDRATFIETLASGKSDFVKVNLTEQSIKVSGKTAIVRHKLSAEINDGGKPGTVNLGVLLVFQKDGGNWKLLARQAFKL
ncbi:MAG: nuclear transport factor 2 family protein [Sphingobacteriaceae bacterium]|nr:nuclear transport factor 2 family protein [Sphingobacteriaceae bacterium]